MIDLSRINWGTDGRLIKVHYYTCSPDNSDNRLNRFLGGWEEYLDGLKAQSATFEEGQKVSWPLMGKLFASILGDISIEKRRAIYGVLLHQYAHSPRTKEWTDEERRKALSYFISDIQDKQELD